MSWSNADVWRAYRAILRAQILEGEGLALSMQQQNTRGISWALISLGDVALDQGDTARATDCFQGALDIFRQKGNQLMSGWAQINLGRVAYTQGDFVVHRHFLWSIDNAFGKVI